MTFIVDKTHRYEIQSCGKSKLEFYLFVFLKMKYTFNAFYYRPFSFFSETKTRIFMERGHLSVTLNTPMPS